MKYLIAFVMIVAASPAFGSDWSRSDTYRQGAFFLVHTIDWMQTREIASNDDWVENNPILGTHPSASDVNRYFLGTALLHTAIAYHLPPEWRRDFQNISIGIQFGTVWHNHRNGVSVKWSF